MDAYAHDHAHDGHGHGHGHDEGGHGVFHHHHHHGEGPPSSLPRLLLRLGVATLVLAGAGLAASAITVGSGQAVVVTRFGDPVRVLTRPGLAWKIPVPVEAAIPVDLRLRTTSSGLQDVGTRDGLRILVQAFAAWQVPDEPDAIGQYVRAVRNDPDEAARQLRSFLGAALQVTASGFDLADLVDTDPARVRLAEFRDRLRAELERQMRQGYGIAVRAVGLEQLGLPEATLAATVSRMRTERETVAAERTAEGLRAAAEIRSLAARDARIEVAEAGTAAAATEAASRREAAAIEAAAYAGDPGLYLMLRSLDTLSATVGPNTRLVLRTDAAPFDALVQGPPGLAAGRAVAGGGPGGDGAGTGSPAADRPGADGLGVDRRGAASLAVAR